MSKYIHLGEFKFEYLLMCKKMKAELLSDYESRIQFIEFELDDILDEFHKEFDVDSEPEPEPVPEPGMYIFLSNSLKEEEGVNYG